MDNMDNTDTELFYFDKKDLISLRSSTGGFQPKFLSADRRFFIKAQAVISGVVMQDWIVEIIASDFCTQLGIPCVVQNECDIVFAGRRYKGVYSCNFEFYGKSFKSFETLLNENMMSTNDGGFIRMDTAEKLRWCADKLSALCRIDFAQCLKYMVDTAVVDCLVGNVDRHTRNFGVFYDNINGVYGIPLIFDSGMGLFENDSYRDNYMTFDDAMHSCYVSPYGEDPFDMVDILEGEFKISNMYKFCDLHINHGLPNKFASEYVERMLSKIRRL